MFLVHYLKFMRPLLKMLSLLLTFYTAQTHINIYKLCINQDALYLSSDSKDIYNV